MGHWHIVDIGAWGPWHEGIGTLLSPVFLSSFSFWMARCTASGSVSPPAVLIFMPPRSTRAL